MRKTLFCLPDRLFLFLLSFVLVFACAQPVCAEEREWLILMYVSGNNDRSLTGSVNELINSLEKVESSEKATVIVHYASLEKDNEGNLQFPREAKTLLIRRDDDNLRITSPIIETSARIDMAGDQNLYLFARKNILKYPSKKVMLLLWGKGEGFKGLMHDDLSQKHMTLEKLAGVLAKVNESTGRKIDIFATDADLMQMAEVVYELKDYAQIIIGFEGDAFGAGYHYDLILQDIVFDPLITPQSLAGSMTYFSQSKIASAIRTDKMPDFMKLANQWTGEIMKDPAALKAAASAIDRTFSFSRKDFKDLCDYIDKVNEFLPAQSPAVRTGNELKNYIRNELVFAYAIISDVKENKKITHNEYIHGLSIYLPDLIYDASAYESRAFASDSQWSNFLRAVLKEKLKK
ncbi:MAG TPA: clostripain-related cysteine peptidase [Acidobacteriota bacterium]|nr:clostripain-related cysteine peptidase [Acidobacteriota bacterium]